MYGIITGTYVSQYKQNKLHKQTCNNLLFSTHTVLGHNRLCGSPQESGIVSVKRDLTRAFSRFFKLAIHFNAYTIFLLRVLEIL